jgi:hypothetical protein
MPGRFVLNYDAESCAAGLKRYDRRVSEFQGVIDQVPKGTHEIDGMSCGLGMIGIAGCTGLAAVDSAVSKAYQQCCDIDDVAWGTRQEQRPKQPLRAREGSESAPSFVMGLGNGPSRLVRVRAREQIAKRVEIIGKVVDQPRCAAGRGMPVRCPIATS